METYPCCEHCFHPGKGWQPARGVKCPEGCNDKPTHITVSIPLEDAKTFDRRYHDADQMTFDDEGRLLAAIRAELRKVGK